MTMKITKLILTSILITTIYLDNSCYASNYSNPYKKIKSTRQKKSSSPSAQLSHIRKKYKYVYLRAAKVNLRAGPSTKYPINWIITQKGEPLKFLTSFYQWIKIETVDGYKGWLQAPMISTRYMYGIIINKQNHPVTAYAMSNIQSRKIVKLEPGVRVRVLKCIDTKWCKIKIDKFKAWLKLQNLWGVNSK